MSTPLDNIKGVGASTANSLVTIGIKSAEDLASASVEQIVTIPGFGAARAQRIKEAATEAIGVETAPMEPEVVGLEAAEQDKPTKKKGKKKEKSKKKGKDKKKKKGKKKK